MSTSQSRKELSHARIVDVAAKAIRRYGYRGVGVADIMKNAGLTHGGFYAHFESRDALMVEAMARAGQENIQSLTKVLERSLTKGIPQFQALVEAYLSDTHIDRLENGCVIAALSSEMTRQESAVRKEAQHQIDSMVALVQSALPDGSDKSEASFVTATMVGALQLARTLGGKAGRSLLTETRQSLIERYIKITHH
jgi:TetR/AcrR family transcriptional repressor of nem operon